jgi:orotidine-5'-phosphate decarboxylase
MPTPEGLTTGTSPEHRSADRLEAARDRLIVALDAPNATAALALVDRLEGTCRWFKVGLELFVATGPSILDPLVARGHSVFLDLKFHDIPNTVAGAVRSAAKLGARMINVHAAGGPAMLAAARNALEGIAAPPQLLAVTVLTSMDQAQTAAVGVRQTPADQVELLARMALEAGICGFVCSAEEVSRLRTLTGPEGVLVTPGIRPAGSAVNDQKRIHTPADALRQGASYLVVGRPITQAANPAAAADAILTEMAAAL